MLEQEHHKNAFELYYSLGESRSLKRIAKPLGVSLASLKLWSRSFDWRQRIREKDADAARAISDAVINGGVEDRARNKQLIKMALLQLAKAIAEGDIKMQLSDLVRLIQLEEFLDEKINGGSDNDDSDLLARIQRLRRLREEDKLKMEQTRLEYNDNQACNGPPADIDS